jgi:hypothetical protein
MIGVVGWRRCPSWGICSLNVHFPSFLFLVVDGNVEVPGKAMGSRRNNWTCKVLSYLLRCSLAASCSVLSGCGFGTEKGLLVGCLVLGDRLELSNWLRELDHTSLPLFYNSVQATLRPPGPFFGLMIMSYHCWILGFWTFAWHFQPPWVAQGRPDSPTEPLFVHP